MRRHNRDGVDVIAFEQRSVIVNQLELLRGDEWRGHRTVDIATRHHSESRTFGETGHDLLAPPAQSDNADPDHCARPLHFHQWRMRGHCVMRNGLDARRAQRL
jgi:hypothetical protein